MMPASSKVQGARNQCVGIKADGNQCGQKNKAIPKGGYCYNHKDQTPEGHPQFTLPDGGGETPHIHDISKQDTEETWGRIGLFWLTGLIGAYATFHFLFEWYGQYLERKGPCTSTMGCYDEFFIPLTLLAISFLSLFLWGAVGVMLIRLIKSRSA